MSMITSCPACGTMFRVVPDQLKISEGWVRCGHCGEVFDASAYLGDEAALARAQDAQPGLPPPADTASAVPVPVPAAAPQPPEESGAFPGALPLAREDVAAGAETQPAGPASREKEPPGTTVEPPARAAPPASTPEPSEFGDSESLEPSPLDRPFVFRRSDLADDLDSSIQPPAPRESQLPDEEELTPAEVNAVSFVREGRRKDFWRRPAVRILLVVASVLLSALLALQLAWQDRERLAVAEPALRPVLQQLCALLDCRLGAPRQIESIVIESSGFNRLRNNDNTYRLAFTLRNTARVPVAVPAMELTITDVQDQAIVRRVLLPADFAAPGDMLPASGDWSRAVGIVLEAPSTARVAGYRLLAFYP